MNAGMRKFVGTLNDKSNAKDDVSIRIGVVDSVDGATIDVVLRGSVIPNVPRLADYTPAVGDRVVVIRSGASLIAIGRVAE